MSAFLVSDKHIGQMALVPCWGERRATPSEDDVILLLEANYRSLNARYSDGMPTPKAIERQAQQIIKDHPQKDETLKSVDLLKMIQCYEYQACEFDGWETSKAHKLCQRYTSTLINKLPGYDKAHWEYR